MFADPFMFTLFDMTHQDTNVPPEEHGTRLGLFFLQRFGGDDKYGKLRGPNMIKNLDRAHVRAKACPMRGKYSGKGFTMN